MIDQDTDWALMDFTDPKKPQAPDAVKGQCPKCGKVIGKGVHFHVKSCDGNLVDADRPRVPG